MADREAVVCVKSAAADAPSILFRASKHPGGSFDLRTLFCHSAPMETDGFGFRRRATNDFPANGQINAAIAKPLGAKLEAADV
jgi:hypothetical protein